MFMIERQYGRCNRDWLYTYGPSDKSTCWVSGPGRAMIFNCREQAELTLASVERSARVWENREHFRFVVIKDRRHLPHYFASTVA